MAAAAALHWPDLTLPQGDIATAKRVYGLFLAKTAALFRSVPLGAVAPHNRALYQTVRGLVDAAEAASPHFSLQVFRSPVVSGLVHCIAGQLRAGGDLGAANGWLRELCGQLLLELAAAGKLPRTVEMGGDEAGEWPILCSPALNLAVRVEARGARMAFGDRQLAVKLADQLVAIDLAAPVPTESSMLRVWRPYHAIAPGLWLTDLDNNPLRLFEAHPDKQGNAADFGGRPVGEWVEALRAAVQLIDAHLPLIGAELRLIGKLFVAVGYEPEKHLSASYKESIGTIYLTLHPQLMTMAEAVVHEFQHNKLNAALHADPLLVNAWSPLYASPVRPDPRPLHGVILAVHAFGPVAMLYERMRDAGHPLAANGAWQQRFAKIVGLVRAGGATVLSHAQPTPAGRPFFAELAEIDRHLAELERQLAQTQPAQALHLDELAGHD